MQKRAVRNEMQREAETSHRGEARWTNMDNYLIERMSSACAIVGFFVGYGVALGKNSTDLCQSRAGQAETTIDFTLLPPLCRPDDVELKNTLLEIKRKKKNRGSWPVQRRSCPVEPRAPKWAVDPRAPRIGI